MPDAEMKKSVKSRPLEIVGLRDGDWRAKRKELMEAAKAIQAAVNDLRALWLKAHYDAGDHVKVREWLAADRAWARSDPKSRGPRVPCPVRCWPKGLEESCRKALTLLHPFVHSRCLGLALRIEAKMIQSAPAPKSAYPRWMMVLAGCGGISSSVNPMPIPFDRANGGLIHDGGNWRFWVRVERIPRDGKMATSRQLELKLKTNGKHLHGLRTILERIEACEYEFAGSKLCERDGKWSIKLCYRMPKPVRVPLDSERIAYLNPAASRPLDLWIDGVPEGLRRRGDDVIHLRRQLKEQRSQRRSAYKDCLSAQRGHGRRKWEDKHRKFRARWQDFAKTYNGQLARDIARRLIEAGVGQLVFYQPLGVRARRRFLAKAGKTDHDEKWTWDPRARRRLLSRAGNLDPSCDPTGWDFFGLKTALATVCEEEGIRFSVSKLGGNDNEPKDLRRTR